MRKRKNRHSHIPQDLLVVRGARFHAREIQELLMRPVPIPEEKQRSDDLLPGILEESLVYQGVATLKPEPDNQYDNNAVAVVVEGRRVGYISRTKAKRVRELVGAGADVDCTIFWNGDPNADYQFYTVQLFSQNKIVYDNISDPRYSANRSWWRS